MKRRSQPRVPKPTIRAKRRRSQGSSDTEEEHGRSGEEVSVQPSESGGSDSGNEGGDSLQILDESELEEDNEGGVQVVLYDDLKEVGPESKRKKGKRKQQCEQKLQWQVWEEEDKRFIDAYETGNVGLNHKDEVSAEAPPDLLVPLLRYQKEWLAWALKQEESARRGGILADEMGMGKTIQAIALVLAKRAVHQSNIGSCKPLLSSTSSTGKLLEIKCTLVICPVAALIQWGHEIARCTPQGSTKVLVYYGANKRKIHDFSEYDFVLTTYATVESEYRKNGLVSKCKKCGVACDPENMTLHNTRCRKYMTRVKQVREELQHKMKPQNQKTKSVLSRDEMNDTDGDREKRAGSKRMKHRKGGKKEGTGSSKSSSADVDQCQPTKKHFLHLVKWDRIILDEAHVIKDRQRNTTKAVFALESLYKWALSGTPLQNNLGELQSLVRFLQIFPHSYFFCYCCECKSLDYIWLSSKCACTHDSHFCWWNKYVGKPIRMGDADERRRAMILLNHKILKSIMLRRTKSDRAADLALPPRTVILRRDALDIKEEDYYKTLYTECQLEFNTYIEAGTLMNNYINIFGLLTRLRQALDHPYLVVYSKAVELKSGCTTDTDNGDQHCGICHEAAEDRVVTSCEHIFCKACLMDFSEALGQALCPLCSKPLPADCVTKKNARDHSTKTTLKGFKSSSILNRISLEDFQTSTKIDALKEEIRLMIEMDGSAKAIVFSQFTSFLDLINYSLQTSGINCVQLVGSMTVVARDAAISKFTNDPNCRIFLVSMKAGGVALNLTIASNVFLMDPWWNSSMELQAYDRIHRIGQYKPIRIVKFIIENTIEEKILKMQEKKESLLEGALRGAIGVLGKLTDQDLRDLFS